MAKQREMDYSQEDTVDWLPTCEMAFKGMSEMRLSLKPLKKCTKVDKL
jgi:hypothetical protein